MAANKPTQYVQWNPSQSNVVQPPDTLRARGYQTNESPLAQHVNWLFWLQDQWTQYFDNSLSNAVMTTTLDSSMRLMGGGTLSFVLSSGTFTWSQALFLSIPSVADADNQIAAGSLSVQPNQVLYVQANVPFTSLGDLTTGTATVQNVGYTAGIAAGQAVTGSGIAAQTTVVSVSGNTVTLSQNVTTTAQQTPITYAGSGALTLQVANVASLVPSANTVIVGRSSSSALYLGVNSGQIILRDGEQRRLLEAGYHDVRYVVAGQAITALQAVHISTGTGGRTQGALYPTDAGATNGATRSICVGFATTSTAVAAVAPVMTGGLLGGFTGLLAGSTYYLDAANVGGITATKPTGVSYAVVVGVAVDATNLYVRVAGASGAPVLDPVYNSLVVQPTTGDTVTTQIVVKDASGNVKALIDGSGNVTSPGTFTTGPVVATTVTSAVGFKSMVGPAFVQQAVSANAQIGTQNSAYGSSILMYENGASQFFSFKMPFAGSLVGMSVSFRYTAAQSAAPTVYITPGLNGAACKFLPNFNSGNTNANVDYAFTATQAKGIDTFKVNDGFGIAYSTTTFSAACTFYMRVTLWVELAS